MQDREYVIKGWQRILLLTIPYVIVVIVFQFIGVVIAGIDLNNIDNATKTTEQYLIVSVFTLLGTFLLLWIFMKWIDKENFIVLGFSIKNRLKEIIVGILLGGIIILLAFYFLYKTSQILFLKTDFDIKEIILTILIFITVAVTEEVLLRGYILRNLMYSYNKYLALIISAVLFSLMHVLNPNISLLGNLNVFLAGIFLGISYIYTKNLWFPIALHFSWNFFQSFFGFNVSGQDIYSFVEFKIPQDNILNGGGFGFEGSILSVISQLIIICCILLYYTKHTKKTI